MTYYYNFLSLKYFNYSVSGRNFCNITDDSHIVNRDEVKSVALLVGNDYDGDKDFKTGIKEDLQNASKVFKHMDHGCFVMFRPNFTKPLFERYLEWLATLKNKTMIAVYFSGHGMERRQGPMMVMQDKREISTYDVISKFDTKELANTKKIFLFDMCRSRHVLDGYNLIYFFVPRIYIRFEMSNTVIMYACSRGEKACMYDEGSIFTDIFAQSVLANPPNEILNLTEICKKVQQKVEQKHDFQHPKFEVTN